MPSPPLSEEVARQTAEFYNKYVRQGYRPLGVSGSGPTAFSMACQDAVACNFVASRTTFQSRLHLPIVQKYLTVGGQTPVSPRIEHEPIPSADEPIEDVIARAEQRFIRAKAAHDANRWRTVRMRGDGPMAIVWFGDPHLDSPGCDWPTLKRDIELVKSTEGVFAANAGDSIDNWVGRLTKLKGRSSVSDSDAWRMAEWFMNELSQKWIAWVLGNHDEWNEGSFIFKRLKGRIVEMDDWQARLILKFDNERECRVHMSHDFPGHSMYNPLHAQKRADMQSLGDAQVYLAGHRHETALSRYPCPIRGKPIIYGRAMGYKAIDAYGAKLGYSRQNEGESIVLVFDPDAETEADFIHGFTTVPSAIQYLGHLRQKHKAKQRKRGARDNRTRRS